MDDYLGDGLDNQDAVSMTAFPSMTSLRRQ